MMKQEKDNTAERVKLPWHAHLVSGWPLGMVAIGGMIGGACGGLAYGLSMALIKKKGVSASSYILACLIGAGCIILYVAIIIGLAIAFPQLFSQE